MRKRDIIANFMKENEIFWYYEHDKKMKCFYVHFKSKSGRWYVHILFYYEIDEHSDYFRTWKNMVLKEIESG